MPGKGGNRVGMEVAGRFMTKPTKLKPRASSSPLTFQVLQRALAVLYSSSGILFLTASEASGPTELRLVLGDSHWNPSLISVRPVLINVYFKPHFKRPDLCEYLQTPLASPTLPPALHLTHSGHTHLSLLFVTCRPLSHLWDTLHRVLSASPSPGPQAHYQPAQPLLRLSSQISIF